MISPMCHCHCQCGRCVADRMRRARARRHAQISAPSAHIQSRTQTQAHPHRSGTQTQTEREGTFISPHSGSPSGMIPPKPRLPYAHTMSTYTYTHARSAQSQTEALSLDGIAHGTAVSVSVPCANASQACRPRAYTRGVPTDHSIVPTSRPHPISGFVSLL